MFEVGGPVYWIVMALFFILPLSYVIIYGVYRLIQIYIKPLFCSHDKKEEVTTCTIYGQTQRNMCINCEYLF